MKFFLIQCLLAQCCVVSQGPVVFPVTIVNGAVELLGLADDFNNDQTFRTRITMSRQILVSRGLTTLNLPEHFHITNEARTRQFSFNDPTAVFSRFNWPAAVVSIGVGPGSLFMERAESVSIVRDPNNVTSALVGISFTDYEFMSQSCFPGSAFRTVFNGDDCVEFMISLRDGNSGYERIAQGMYETCFGLETTPRLDPNAFMTMPFMIASNLTNRVRQWGANRNEDGPGFTECDSSLLAHLPDIVVSFFGNIGGTVGSIVLSPRDYVLIDESAETCKFRFRSVNPASETMFIDPLRLPYVNVHITQSDLLFCDPL